MTLSPSDLHHLRAAEGWLELGDWRSANDEVDSVTPELRAHPDVLRMRFQVYSAAPHWEPALAVAKTLCDLVPNDVNALIHRSFALHELKRTAEAEALLLPALDRFPDEPTIAYNLACYLCVLGRVEEARSLLDRAIAVSGDHGDEVKLMARDDPDLKGLWTSTNEGFA